MRGHTVVLLDRRLPGEEDSHGNARLIRIEGAEPYAMLARLADAALIDFRRRVDVNFHLDEVFSARSQLIQLAEFCDADSGPASARLLVDVVDGRTPYTEAKAFEPGRY